MLISPDLIRGTDVTGAFRRASILVLLAKLNIKTAMEICDDHFLIEEYNI